MLQKHIDQQLTKKIKLSQKNHATAVLNYIFQQGFILHQELQTPPRSPLLTKFKTISAPAFEHRIQLYKQIAVVFTLYYMHRKIYNKKQQLHNLITTTSLRERITIPTQTIKKLPHS
jgi:hypothetical protein